MRHYFPLCVGFQEVLNANECVMRREPEKSQSGSRRDIGVNAPLSSHIYSSIDSADMDQKITLSQVGTRSTGEKEHEPYPRVDYSLRGDRNGKA